jgi:probable HAF family extracellular repeat protein
MNFGATSVSMATACALLLVAACGGSGQLGDASESTQSQVGSAGGTGSQSQSGTGGLSVTSGQSQPTAAGSGICDPNVRYVAIDLGFAGYPRTGGWGIGGGQQVGQGGSGDSASTIVEHAVLWQGTGSSIVDLHPNGFTASGASATDGTTQVGSGTLPNGKGFHALKWSGSADTVVDLDPNGFNSGATGVAGDQIVGYSEDMNGQFHALLWTSGGVVDLTPTWAASAEGKATDGAQQVGGVAIAGEFHATLWSGSASSAVDLHPAAVGSTFTAAFGVGGGQQVGYALFWRLDASGGHIFWEHALLWSGSAESVVDLHPSGFYRSWAKAVAGGCQVGGGTANDGTEHALLWRGSADSVVDLNAFLPAGFGWAQANAIDASGNIIGTAGTHAILWIRQ